MYDFVMAWAAPEGSSSNHTLIREQIALGAFLLRSHDFVKDSVCLAAQNSSAYAFTNCKRLGSGGLRTLGSVLQTMSPQGRTSKRSPNKIGSLRNKHRELFAHGLNMVLVLLPKEAYSGGVGHPPCLAGEESPEMAWKL